MKKNIPSESFVIISGLAQEINAPLKSLLLTSQKLLDNYKKKDFEYVSYKDFKCLLFTIEQMNKQIGRCYQTTERMIGLNKSRAKGGSCSVNDVVKDVLGLLSQQFEFSKIKLQSRFQEKLPLVNLSRVEGHQVVHNVLTNAMHAMPAGGVIKIKSSLDKKTGFVALDISDEGVGINPQHLPKVFEPFFTTTEQGLRKSSGLGLSIVYSIVQTAGGTINIKSSLRRGTQVKIFLPILKS